MKQVLLFFAIAICATALQAQKRYLQPVFQNVTVSQPTQYQNNFSIIRAILTSNPANAGQVPDFFQAYTPTGDTETNRPVVIINTTGSYFPQFVGGGIFGTLNDSVVVNTAKRFARMGYVAIVSTYRQGWNPTATEVNARTGSLLIASYRGMQDLRSMTRFLRNSAAGSNPYGINPNAIMALGYGTGAYNVYTNNFLDTPEEVNTLPKFINTASGNPFLDVSLYGNPDGTTMGQQNIPQNVGPNSRINFSAAIGGALGDSTWIGNNPSEEAPIVALHSVRDENAPYAVGDVFVPVSLTERLFVIRVDGPRSTINRANRLGVNDPLKEVNAVLRAANDFLTVRVAALRTVPFTTRDQITTTFAVENFYPFVSDLSLNTANTYNFIDSTQLVTAVAAYDSRTGVVGATAAQRLAAERRNNPNITNPVRARRVLDTIMSFVTPRAFIALKLGTVEEVRQVVNVVDIEPQDVGFAVYPNPASDYATIEVNADVELQVVALYDAQGRRVSSATISGSKYGMDLTRLPVGLYYIYAQTSEGTLSHPVMVTR